MLTLRNPHGRNSERTQKISSTNREKTSPLSGLRTVSEKQNLTTFWLHPTSPACAQQARAASRSMVAYVPYVHTVTQPQKLSVCVNRCISWNYSRKIKFIQWSTNCQMLQYHFRCMVTFRAFGLCYLHIGIYFPLRLNTKNEAHRGLEHISVTTVYCLLPLRKKNAYFTELCLPKALWEWELACGILLWEL